MDIVFWFGIAVGAMVGIPVSIVANLWTDPVRGFLSHRRTIRLSRNKHKELSSYYFVRRIIGGDEAAKAVLAFRQTLAHGCMTLTGVYASLLILIVVLYTYDMVTRATALMLFLLVGAVSILISSVGAVTFIKVWRIVTRLRNFPSYEASVIERWGKPSDYGDP